MMRTYSVSSARSLLHFGPALVWTSRVAFQEELIEHDIDSAVAEPLAKRAHTLFVFVIGLSIAEEDFRHKTYKFVDFNYWMIDLQTQS